MTREQAEKLKQEKRRKRLRRKRIKAICTLTVLVAVVAVAVVFAVKGITAKNNADTELDSPIGSAGIITETNDNSDETVVEPSAEPTDTETENTDETANTQTPADPQQTEEPKEEPAQTTPVATKPEQSWSTMLVNQWSYMPEGYVPEVRPINYQGVSPANNKFDVRAADALEQMLADARAAGYNMYLVSAYRTHDYQINLYNRKVNEYLNKGYDETTARSEASQWVAIPGTSEHCIGLAADIVSSTWYNYNSDLTHDFENTEHFEWLYNHCADYGFILRYPKGKESITGITYEPWHYRFVGIEAAKYIMSNGITLEEFHA